MLLCSMTDFPKGQRMKVWFITHPEVAIDPAVPVPEWPLSDRGRRRATAMLRQPWVQGLEFLACSHERKAIDTAEILATHTDLPIAMFEGLEENNRSATGYLPPAEFQATADLFFAHPDQSIRGWETARAAQTRIIAAVDRVVAAAAPLGGDVAIVAHGGVGALLLCHLKDCAISRREDQPGAGGGNYFVFDMPEGRLLQGWRAIDAIEAPVLAAAG
jgi:broad specificity phosphatase PhoE